MTKTIHVETKLPSNINADSLKNALDKYKESGFMLGAIDHKDKSALSMSLDDVVCKHEALKVEDDKLVGKVELLDTPKGKIAQSLLENRFEFDFAPRIMKDNEGNYRILSMDLTRKPGTPALTPEEELDIEVRRFIQKFRTAETQALFTGGCCYWFAHILYTRFTMAHKQPEIWYNEVSGHFATMINKKLYDITGEIKDKDDKWIKWDEFATKEPSFAAQVIKDCIFKTSDSKVACMANYKKYGKNTNGTEHKD